MNIQTYLKPPPSTLYTHHDRMPCFKHSYLEETHQKNPTGWFMTIMDHNGLWKKKHSKSSLHWSQFMFVILHMNKPMDGWMDMWALEFQPALNMQKSTVEISLEIRCDFVRWFPILVKLNAACLNFQGFWLCKKKKERNICLVWSLKIQSGTKHPVGPLT